MDVTTPKVFDVVVVGAGAAGLQATASLLQQRPSLSIAILERCSAAGGRIRDVQFADGIEVAGIGAWRIDPESKLVLDLLQRYAIPMEPWKPEIKRFEARGACVNSVEELRTRIYHDIPPESELANLKTSMVPDFLQRTLAKSIVESANSEFPTRLGDLMRKSLGEDGEQFLSAISHGYKALAEYDIDIMGTLASANAGSETTRPVGGMSQIISVLESECSKGGALFRYCALVKGISRSSEDGSTVYDITYMTTRGRVLPGSDTLSAQDFDKDATTNVIRARSVVLAVPPSAIARIAHQNLSSSQSSNILREITDNPLFRSCFGVPAFRAAALYSYPWWDDSMHGLQPLGERGTLLTSSSPLSMVFSYAGRGPNGEAALHLSYCNDFDARRGDGFWSECIKSAVARSGFDYEIHPSRPRALDEVMYQYIREELAKAFVVQPQDIPDPIRLEWHHWDDGAVHVQQPVDGHSSISRKMVEDWAVNGPLISRGPDGASGDRIVLVGEGFSEKWAWVEGALVSATRGAETILSWCQDSEIFVNRHNYG